ncbi:hypothetical protein NQ318_007934 [Aromia moschata]|uniref:F-box domain-containing protein n=1 Tax=Aromia moschata TaxID=1265417 RepID=A0AAV8XZX7_9CUCU|nr:hypothetical protein NQ318_007934 [Aromia moschata]
MDRLPQEILWEILSYLNIYDLLQFSEAYRNYNFLKEKHLIRIVDLSRRFELQKVNLYTLVTKDLTSSYIKVLNVSCLYWISADQLRRLIKQLENLEILYAIDTKLGMKDKDIDEYVKLKKLAVTVEDNQFYHSTVIASQQLKNLKSLCLKFTQKKGRVFRHLFIFSRNEAVRRVVGNTVLIHIIINNVYDEYESNYRIDYSRLVIALKRLNKFVIKSKVALPYYDFKCDGLLSTFACKRCDSATELIFGKVKNQRDPFLILGESDLERCWELFENLHKDLPCGAKESKQIYMKKAIKEIYFEDLNFCHAVILCNTKYISAALQILSAKNSTKLKRLSFRSCLFQDTHKQTRDEKTSGFKKPRRGVQINTDTHPFRSVADNIKCLTELEIFICPGCSGEAVLSAYPLIQIFENLQKLTLDVPILMDGLFFKEYFRNFSVFTKCQCLESLNLNCVGQNGKFLLNLCQNLKYARNLRDFRLEHKDIVIDKLFDGLNGMEHKRLLRVFLKCDNLQYTCETIKIQPRKNSNIQKILNNSKKGNPAKVFYVKNDVSAFMGVFPIPAAHHDIIFNYTNVSVIRIDEF